MATAPPGRTLGVTCKGAGALTVIDRGAGVVAVCAGIAESITCSVNWNTPAIVGVPLICPDVVLNVSPGGKLPEVLDHVKGGTPPEVTIDVE